MDLYVIVRGRVYVRRDNQSKAAVVAGALLEAE